jgi:Cu(I)/Ag(I) efflux system membrane fusion protein
MNKNVLVFIVVSVLGGLAFFYPTDDKKAQSSELGATYVAGNYQVQIQLSPDKPKIGNNELTLSLTDVNDHPVNNASLTIYAEMPAMGSMQAMREVVTIDESSNGLYQGHYTLPMNGSWPLTVHIESKSLGQADMLFDMNTSRQGVQFMEGSQSDLSAKPSQSTSSKKTLKSFKVDPYRRQLIGVTTAKVMCQNLFKTIQVGAIITEDKTKLSDITLKYDGWIGQLTADYLGKKVKQGDVLFTVYSPDLISLQDEYLDSLKQTYPLGLTQAISSRLALLDINKAQINALKARGKTSKYLPFFSPAEGTLIEKNVLTGSAIKAGQTVLRLADLSTVWVEGEVYESDLPWVKVGMKVDVVILDKTYSAKLIFIDPLLNPNTRSITVRVKLDNTEGFFRPGMYAAMNLQVALGERVVIPEQAVIYSGQQRVVFVDKGEGRLLPVKIKTGVRNAEMIEVVYGLDHGEQVVTSGNFLIAAESKLKAGLAQW